jgi:PTH1 family peptidyl-tRNA hydrolase
LGNPGRQYALTRHNIGFMVAEELARRWDLPRAKDRFRGRIAEGRVPAIAASSAASAATADYEDVGPAEDAGPGEDAVRGDRARARTRAAPLHVAILCPQTYMNEAGRSVGPARGALRLALERVLVVHDEIDLPFGEVRSRLGGGLAGHNGLKSLQRELGSAEFARVRVGVGRPASTDPEIVSSYVLGRFGEPPERVCELVERACEEVERIVLGQGG